MTLKHVIKTLAARRLVNYRKVFYDVTTSLFIYIVGLWSGHLQEGVAQISAGSADSAVETLEMSRVCLKSKLIIFFSEGNKISCRCIVTMKLMEFSVGEQFCGR